MQDKYVADIGDFGKFFLFRKLFDGSKSLVILWFYHQEKENNSDGSIINYFDRVKGLDSKLEKGFQRLLKNNKRSLKSLQNLNLLKSCSYFDKVISDNRAKWFYKALEFAKEANIISIAADNGVALKCDRKNKTLTLLDSSKEKSNSYKYIFLEEIEALFTLAKLEILVLYYHLNRCFSHSLQTSLLLKEFQKRFPFVAIIKHKPYSPRLYIFVVKKQDDFFPLLEKLQKFSQEYSNDWELLY